MSDTILSVVIIAKNAEGLIVDAIKSVEFADEILVIDGGSTDNTNAVAKSHGATIVKGVDTSFAEQRNIGAKTAKGKWIFYLDTDERVSPLLAKNIQFQISNSCLPAGKVKSSHYQPIAYKVLRQNFYLGNNPWPKIEHLERLFNKDHLKGWYGKLHETAKVDGQVGLLEGYLLHYTHRDLESMLAKTITWSQVEAKLRLDNNHPKIVWWRLIRVMITGFWDSYILQGGYKAGTMGLVESMYQSYSMFITYASLWEMQNKNSTKYL